MTRARHDASMSRPPRARQPIKDAALRLFVEQGVHATGIREIASAAGCSEAALYRHWTNKEDLVASLFTEHMGEVSQLLSEAIASAGSDRLAPCLRAACHAAFRLYDEHPLVFRFVMLFRHELLRFLPAGQALPQDVLIGLYIAHGMDLRQATLAAAAAMGSFLMVSEFVAYGRLPGPLSDYVDAVFDMLPGLQLET